MDVNSILTIVSFKCSAYGIKSLSLVRTVLLLVLTLVSTVDSLGEFCSMFGAECRATCHKDRVVQVTFQLCESHMVCCLKSQEQPSDNRGLPNPDLSNGQIPFYKNRYQPHLYPKPFQTVTTPNPFTGDNKNDLIPPPTVCGVRGHSRVRRIVNGAPAERCEYPWIVMLDRGPNPWDTCGASLISDRHILTAAHCFGFAHTPKLVIGEYDKNELRPASEIRTTNFNVTIHPQFDNIHFMNDIAVVTLNTPLDLTKYQCLRPICIPDQNEALPVGTECQVVGWGSVQRVNEVGVVPRTANILQETTISVVRSSLCQRLWKSNYHPGIQICAGDMAGQTDSCLGDSGGPLMCSSSKDQDVSYLHGIVSLGSSTCATPNVPALYTDVGKFKTWIESVIRK